MHQLNMQRGPCLCLTQFDFLDLTLFLRISSSISSNYSSS